MTNTHALIIEDDIMNAEILEFMLNSSGVSCTSIDNPHRVLDIVPQLSNIDVVFLDLEMPGINGYQMLQILRDTLKLTAPIVACTVHTSQIDIARAKGFDGFLGKPLMAERFPEQLERILGGESLWELP
ncbi:MAG: response regulator [Anaerolineae bacterium]|nr:response regulator [Anaerolineae bacterium]